MKKQAPSQHCPIPSYTLTSHPLQSFTEGRFSAAPMQRDGKNRHMIARQRWPQVSGSTHGELLMEKHVDGQREADIVKCWLLMYVGAWRSSPPRS